MEGWLHGWRDEVGRIMVPEYWSQRGGDGDDFDVAVLMDSVETGVDMMVNVFDVAGIPSRKLRLKEE